MQIFREIFFFSPSILPYWTPLPILCVSFCKLAIIVEKWRNFAFSCKKICIYQKKVVPLHHSPGNSSPRLCAGEESGFFFYGHERIWDYYFRLYSSTIEQIRICQNLTANARMYLLHATRSASCATASTTTRLFVGIWITWHACTLICLPFSVGWMPIYLCSVRLNYLTDTP